MSLKQIILASGAAIILAACSPKSEPSLEQVLIPPSTPVWSFPRPAGLVSLAGFGNELDWCEKRVEKYDSEKLSNETSNIPEMQWPFIGPLTTYFGEAGLNGKPHGGIDIEGYGKRGDPIAAAYDSKVVVAKWDDWGLGYHVVLDNGTFFTVYGHLSEIWVTEKQEMRQGEALGALGSTGYSTGPHLHFEVATKDEIISEADINRIVHCSELADANFLNSKTLPEYTRFKYFSEGTLVQYPRIDPLQVLP